MINSHLRSRLLLWIILAVIVFAGAWLRFDGITRIGLEGSDNTYITNIAKRWSEGDRVYCIGDNWTLFRPVVYEVFGLAVRHLGFNDASIKITNASLDTLNIALVFLLAFILSRRNPWAATAAATVYALLPFTILISRSEQTHILSTSTLLAALVLFALSRTAESPKTRLALLLLSGVATGLAALTHEDLIFTAAGPAALLVLSAWPECSTARTRLTRTVGPAAAYAAAVVLTAHQMLLTHRTEATVRTTNIVSNRIAQSHYLEFIARPLKFAWNAVNGSGSTVLAALVVVLMLVLGARWCRRLFTRQATLERPILHLEDLPLWTVAGYLLLYSAFFSYFAVRLFVPLIPLVIVWLMVRTAALVPGVRRAPAVLAILTLLIVVSNIGHVAGIRDYEFSHFRAWAPGTPSADLRPDRGWSEFRRRLSSPSWARQRFDELGEVVDENSRLLVASCRFHPFPGRRVLQIGYYFGDEAVYLFDHERPLDQLIDEKKITYVLFTVHQTYDSRAVQWSNQQRYLGEGRWGPRRPVTLGASLGFSPGEYTIPAEFDRLRTAISRRGGRIILGQGELLRLRPSAFRSASFVVWTLDPSGWAPFDHARTAMSTARTEASAGRLGRALTTLRAAEAGADPLVRFNLRLFGARLLAHHHQPAKACKRLAGALGLLPRDTTLCTILREVFPTPSQTTDMVDLLVDLQHDAPKNPGVRDLLVALSVNLAEFALENGDADGAVDAFRDLEHHLDAPGNRRFRHAVTDWCADRARALDREGRTAEARAALTTAAGAYRHFLANESRPSTGLLLTAGRSFSDLGRHDEAVAALSKGADVNPGDPLIRSNLCLALRRKGDDERAQEACAETLALQPGNVLASTETARLLGRKGRWAEASETLIGLLKAHPAEFDTAREIERVSSAGEAVIEGLVDHGQDVDAAALAEAVGRFLTDRGHHEQAVATLLTATRIRPGDGNLWTNLCLAQRRAGRPDAALDACRQALDLDHDRFWARMISAEVLAADEQWPEALEQADRAAHSPPPDGGHTQNLIHLARRATEAGFPSEACTLLGSIEKPDAEAVAGALEALDCPVHSASGN